MIKKFVTWLIGKKIMTETGHMSAVSKTKLAAVIGAILAAVGPISQAWGHPVTVPNWVYEVLAAAGLWAVRDAIPSK